MCDKRNKLEDENKIISRPYTLSLKTLFQTQRFFT